MTTLGTAYTLKRWASSGNSPASTISARTRGLSIARKAASLAAWGQWGQVGVTKTWRCTSRDTCAKAARVSSATVVAPRETAMMTSISVANS